MLQTVGDPLLGLIDPELVKKIIEDVRRASETTIGNGGRRVRCKKCGDIIQSIHRHDSVWCKCKSINVDGGGDYLRLSWTDGGNPWDSIEVLPPDTDIV